MRKFIDAAKLIVGSWVVVGGVVALSGACGGTPDKIGAPGGAGGAGATSVGSHHGAGGANAGGSGGMIASAYADEGGTRLKANVLMGADGSKHYTGNFHDTMRSEDCAFSTAADGKTRCLPAATPTSVYFSAIPCVDPLVAVPNACPKPPKYASVISACGAAEIHTLGAKSTSNVVYVGSPSSCVQTQTPTEFDFYALGAEVSASSFVEATPSSE